MERQKGIKWIHHTLFHFAFFILKREGIYEVNIFQVTVIYFYMLTLQQQNLAFKFSQKWRKKKENIKGIDKRLFQSFVWTKKRIE